MAVEYVADLTGRLWWCNTHQRRASHVRHNHQGTAVHCCDPSLGGIMIPCECIDLTTEVEVE